MIPPLKDRFAPPPAPVPIRVVGTPLPTIPHRVSAGREIARAWEDEQVCRKLDFLTRPQRYVKYALMRAILGGSHAVIPIRADEDPGEVARALGAEVAGLTDDCLPEAVLRLEAERDRLNAVVEVMDS